jgi:hypothetical protein
MTLIADQPDSSFELQTHLMFGWRVQLRVKLQGYLGFKLEPSAVDFADSSSPKVCRLQ